MDTANKSLSRIDRSLSRIERSTKLQPREEYVFKYMLISFMRAEKSIHEAIQSLGVGSLENLTIDQSLISLFESDLEKLNSKDEATLNDYFEDHFNLALSNLSQNLPALTNHHHHSNNNNSLLQNSRSVPFGVLNNSAEQFSFKLPDHDKENIKDDLLLKLTQHLENKILMATKYLRDAVEMNKSPDFKALRERNVELVNQLKEELKMKNELVQKLIAADRQASEYFDQLQLNEEELKNLDALRSQNEDLKRQMRQYNADFRKLCKEKEELEKYKLLFKDDLPGLEKKLKSDLESSKQQIELIEKERDECAAQLLRLKADKEKQEELNQQLVKELELQKENFEHEIAASQKQLENQKKFLESQTQERESEIDEYVASLAELQRKLKEKESKELNYLEKIQQFEEQVESLNDEKQQLDKCYQETCSRLTNESKRNKQLQGLLEEYERTKEKTQQVEKELRERLNKLEEDLYSQLKLNETLKKSQTEQSSGIISSFVDNVCDVEHLRCSNSNHESNLMKTMSLLRDQHTKSIQETIAEQAADGSLLYQSSSVDCTFPDAKQLEEKNCKLNQFVERVVKENGDLNDELKEVRRKNEDLENKIQRLRSRIEELKLDLEKMVMERKVIESRIEEKETKLRELNQQLEARMSNENEAHLKQSIESLKRKLHEEEQKVQQLNDELKKTDLSLTRKQNEIYKTASEIERVKTEKCKIENERLMLQRTNKALHDERARLLHEIEELQNERDDENDSDDIKEMFETVLQDKDEEIENLNGCLNEISAKLRDCLPTSTVGQSSLTLLDELISFYQRSSKHQNQFAGHARNNHNQYMASRTSPLNNHRIERHRPESESFDSLSPIESCEDHLSSDEDDLCSKLAGIHNNSVEICNLSFHFKNEKGLIKLINEIPEIVTNERLAKKEIAEWQTSFVDCFSNRNIAQLLTKHIISLRSTYLNNAAAAAPDQSAAAEKEQLLRQLDECKARLRSENLKFNRCNASRKALIFQKKYLMNVAASAGRPQQWLFNNRHQQVYRRQSSATHTSGRIRFRIVAFAVIAMNRIRAMKKQRDFIESYDQSDATNIIEQLNQLTHKLDNVLRPSVDQYSSFINSLHSNKPQVPFKTNHQTHPPNNHPLNNHPNNHHPNNHHAEPNKSSQPLAKHHSRNEPHHHPSNRQMLKDLRDNLADVCQRLGLEETFASSPCSSMS